MMTIQIQGEQLPRRRRKAFTRHTPPFQHGISTFGELWNENHIISRYRLHPIVKDTNKKTELQLSLKLSIHA